MLKTHWPRCHRFQRDVILPKTNVLKCVKELVSPPATWCTLLVCNAGTLPSTGNRWFRCQTATKTCRELKGIKDLLQHGCSAVAVLRLKLQRLWGVNNSDHLIGPIGKESKTEKKPLKVTRGGHCRMKVFYLQVFQWKTWSYGQDTHTHTPAAAFIHTGSFLASNRKCPRYLTTVFWRLIYLAHFSNPLWISFAPLTSRPSNEFRFISERTPPLTPSVTRCCVTSCP